MIDEKLDIKYFVDPGAFHAYKEQPILDFLEWIEKWDKPVRPSNRYYMLKKSIVYWGAHKFMLGLASEEDADEFLKEWGGIKIPPKPTGQFAFDEVDYRSAKFYSPPEHRCYRTK